MNLLPGIDERVECGFDNRQQLCELIHDLYPKRCTAEFPRISRTEENAIHDYAWHPTETAEVVSPDKHEGHLGRLDRRSAGQQSMGQ